MHHPTPWSYSPKLLPAIQRDNPRPRRSPRLRSGIQAPLTGDTLQSTAGYNHNPERLKMTTRIAIRDKTPHRFQVVPLHDAPSYADRSSTRTHLPTDYRRPVVGTNSVTRALVDLDSCDPLKSAGQSPRNMPSTSPQTAHKERSLSDRSRISSSHAFRIITSPSMAFMGPPSAERKPTSHQSISSDCRSSISEYSQYSLCLDDSCPDLRRLRSSLQSNASEMHNRRRLTHSFKSPSLVISKTPISTPSASLGKQETAIAKMSKRKMSDTHFSKRHAIYSLPQDSIQAEHPPLKGLTGDSEIYDDPSIRIIQDHYAIDLTDYYRDSQGEISSGPSIQCNNIISGATPGPPPATPSHQFTSLESRSTVSSVYSQDATLLHPQPTIPRTRPLTCYGAASRRPQGSKIRKAAVSNGNIVHHPVISALLREVDDLMAEWSSILKQQ